MTAMATPAPEPTPSPPRLDQTTLQSLFTSAIASARPTDAPAPYTKVKVLFMSWEKDDLDIDSEIKPLESIFSGLYHFSTEMYKIPLRRCAQELGRKIVSTIRADGQQNNLLIFYYGGHARPATDNTPLWFANRTPTSPVFKLAAIEPLLRDNPCDTLLLFDCPHSSTTSQTATSQTIQTLAASSLSSGSDGPRPFTLSLIQELAHAAYTNQPLSIVDLHSRLIARLQNLQPKVHFDDAYSVVQLEGDKTPVVEPFQLKMPVHGIVGSDNRGIVLRVLPGDEQGENVLVMPPPTGNATKERDVPDVLVAVRLEGVFDEAKWREWVVELGDVGRGVRVTGVYPSFGSLALLRVPVAVWDLMERREGVSFVGYAMGRETAVEVPEVTEEEVVKAMGGNGVTWPWLFTGPKTDFYAEERKAYCLDRVGEEEEEEGFKERVVEEFTKGENHLTKYVGEEIREFCLSGTGDSGDEFVAILDERPGDGDMKFLRSGELLDALKPATPNKRKRRDSKMSHMSEEPVTPMRRFIYITSPGPLEILSLAATASASQVPHLRTFIHKHLTLQTDISIRALETTPPSTFQLTFHLPILTLRTAPPSPDSRGLRNHTILSATTLYESQISCTVSGIDNHQWTAHALFDTYHDAGHSKYDISSYKATPLDPLTGGPNKTDPPAVDPREYFLQVLESAMANAKVEWLNTCHGILKEIRECRVDAEGNGHREIVQASEQAQALLGRMVSEWRAFQGEDVGFFEGISGDVDVRLLLRRVGDDVREMERLRMVLEQETDMLKTGVMWYGVGRERRAKVEGLVLGAVVLGLLSFLVMVGLGVLSALGRFSALRYAVGLTMIAAGITGLIGAGVKWGEIGGRVEEVVRNMEDCEVPDVRGVFGWLSGEIGRRIEVIKQQLSNLVSSVEAYNLLDRAPGVKWEGDDLLGGEIVMEDHEECDVALPIS
ncbi:hypothetical protein OQA88_5449 [Cercophora sp. LCS_1]